MATHSGAPESRGQGWSAGSQGFEKYIAPTTRLGCQAMIDMLNAALLITPSSNILDCGAGTGASASLLRAQFPSPPILAFDIAPGMVERLQQLRLPNVQLGVSDATAMDRSLIPRQSFTHAIGAFMIQFCGAKQRAVLSELFDSLVPGGVAVVSLSTDINMGEPWHRACERLDPTYRRVYVHEEQAWKSAGLVVDEMLSMGFEDIRARKMWCNMPACRTADDYIDFWFNGEHPAFKREFMGWRGDPEEVKPMLRTVLEEEFPDVSVVGIAAEIVLGRKPLKYLQSVKSV